MTRRGVNPAAVARLPCTRTAGRSARVALHNSLLRRKQRGACVVVTAIGWGAPKCPRSLSSVAGPVRSGPAPPPAAVAHLVAGTRGRPLMRRPPVRQPSFGLPLAAAAAAVKLPATPQRTRHGRVRATDQATTLRVSRHLPRRRDRRPRWPRSAPSMGGHRGHAAWRSPVEHPRPSGRGGVAAVATVGAGAPRDAAAAAPPGSGVLGVPPPALSIPTLPSPSCWPRAHSSAAGGAAWKRSRLW